MRYPILKDPYVITGVIFIVIILTGNWLWGWEKHEYGFVLLLYFIVTIGIRLDDISKHIEKANETLNEITKTGGPASDSMVSPNAPDILHRLDDLQMSVQLLNTMLQQITDKIEPPKPS